MQYIKREVECDSLRSGPPNQFGIGENSDFFALIANRDFAQDRDTVRPAAVEVRVAQGRGLCGEGAVPVVGMGCSDGHDRGLGAGVDAV